MSEAAEVELFAKIVEAVLPSMPYVEYGVELTDEGRRELACDCAHDVLDALGEAP